MPDAGDKQDHAESKSGNRRDHLCSLAGIAALVSIVCGSMANETSRRAFIAGAAAAPLAAGAFGVTMAGPALASPSSAGDPDPGKQRRPHEHYNRELFEDARKNRLILILNGERVDLTIDQIEPLGVSADAREGSRLWNNAFRVLLSGPPGVDIPQGSHPVRINDKRFDLFVVPVIRSGNTPTYEAIINRAYRGGIHG